MPEDLRQTWAKGLVAVKVEKEKVIDIILKIKNEKMPLDLIIKVTGLTEEEIKEI